MMVDSLLDYDDVCANPKHDPRKKGCKNAPWLSLSLSREDINVMRQETICIVAL